MNWHDRIKIRPDVLSGKPVVKGTRISVVFVVELLAHGWSVEDLLEQYPALTREDVQACLHYASEVLKSDQVDPLSKSGSA
ncbi:DUF433 domain-containing protein [Longimonas sp.]|uniref:DUF433 domain-containing protein n=1 Tax=Longimonas sp. TaxID=2039626 RepID=UPI00336536D5